MPEGERKERERDTAPPIPLPFEEAVKAALETDPEPNEDKPFGKRKPGPKKP